MAKHAQPLGFALLVGFAVLGALELDRRLAGCPDRGGITIAPMPTAPALLDAEAYMRRVERQHHAGELL